ncbi:MarR family winged helix-turn-helix transcriptional regulator [Diaphorobacter caeni]|uniref:MarR family winged helix-turn-helix transcriptional regulator n=1 Tax=Diaphorobacter caeni TaxID=2784387 RepID=UPI0018904009|nr:MarR family transcriptional regulator [Diaphorobacter caeni]MBF5004846.1 MarR family transcriptional regulator [Diaphorobacter caeni]
MTTPDPTAPNAYAGLPREDALLKLTRSMGFCNARYVPIANKAVAHLGLSEASTWPLLAVSRYGDGLRQGVIADILGIKAPSLTRPLDYLEDAGLIERRDDPVDGRAKTLHLTHQGRELTHQIEAALKTLRHELFRGASDADVEACLRVFSALEDRMGRVTPDVAPLKNAAR